MSFRDEDGQMAVELAVVMPVILIVLVFAIDALVFAGECARFDQIAPQRILASAVSPSRGGYDMEARRSAVQAELEGDFAKNGSQVIVSYDDSGVPLASISTFTCTFVFAPWPFASSSSPVKINHSCSLAIDPYTPGELI